MIFVDPTGITGYFRQNQIISDFINIKYKNLQNEYFRNNCKRILIKAFLHVLLINYLCNFSSKTFYIMYIPERSNIIFVYLNGSCLWGSFDGGFGWRSTTPIVIRRRRGGAWFVRCVLRRWCVRRYRHARRPKCFLFLTDNFRICYSYVYWRTNDGRLICK